MSERGEIFEDSIPGLNYDGEQWIREDAYQRLQDDWRKMREAIAKHARGGCYIDEVWGCDLCTLAHEEGLAT